MKKVISILGALFALPAMRAAEMEKLPKKNRSRSLICLLSKQLPKKTKLQALSQITGGSIADAQNRIIFGGYVWLLNHGDKEHPVEILESTQNTTGSFEDKLNKKSKSEELLNEHKISSEFKKDRLLTEFNIPQHEFYSGLFAELMNKTIRELPRDVGEPAVKTTFEKLQAYAELHDLQQLAAICQDLPKVYKDEGALLAIESSLRNYTSSLSKKMPKDATKRSSLLAFPGLKNDLIEEDEEIEE